MGNLFIFGVPILSQIGDAIANLWFTIWLSLCNGVYSLIGALYRVFEAVANINLFSQDIFDQFVKRIYIIMGVAMLFIFAYNIILLIINPSDKNGSGNGLKLVKETFISLTLIALMPTIFNYMAILQKHILDTNIIGQVIIGDSGGTSKDCDYNNYTLLGNYANTLQNECNNYKQLTSSVRGAYSVGPTLFMAFFRPAEYSYLECEDYVEACHDKTVKDSCGTTNKIKTEADKAVCVAYYSEIKQSFFHGSITPVTSNAAFYIALIRHTNQAFNSVDFDFNYFFGFIAGLFGLYMFLSYTLAIGVRVAKLGFLQIISPVTIMLRMVPNQDKIFSSWLTELKNTYLDVFIRLILIYFSMFAITLLPDVIKTVFSGNVLDNNPYVKIIATAVLVLGVLKFASEAPELLKKFLPSGGGEFSLKRPSQQIKDNKLAMGTINTLRGGVYGLTTGKDGHKVRDMFRGMGSTITHGGKYEEGVKSVDTYRTEVDENGSSLPGRTLDRLRMAIGMETRGAKDSRLATKDNEKLKMLREDDAKLKGIKDLVTTAITKETSKAKMTGFSFTANGHTTNFSGMSYVQTKAFEEALREQYETAAPGATRDAAYQQYVNFQNALATHLDGMVTDGMNQILQGRRDLTSRPGTDIFSESDVAQVRSDVAGVVSHGYKAIPSINNATELKNARDEIGRQSNETATGYERRARNKRYTARQADDRMVHGNGNAEKH